MVGLADLPLHSGKVPRWILDIMRRMARAIVEIAIIELGEEKLALRLSNPLWFQAFNNAIGMDWDSSGSTTVVTAVIKEVCKELEYDFHVFGGKGKEMMKIEEEARSVKDLDVEKVVKSSILMAKADSVLLQDGYTIYHNSIFVGGKVITGIHQGMNTYIKMARRYHWTQTENFLVEPREITGERERQVIDYTSKNKDGARKMLIDLLNEKPEKVLMDYYRAYNLLTGKRSLDQYFESSSITIIDKEKRIIYFKPINEKLLLSRLKIINEAKPKKIEEAMLNGLTPSVTKALALISDLIYNEPPSYDDPVKYPYDPFKWAYTIGGKDGIPYRIRRDHADKVIKELEDIINKAKIDSKNREKAIKRLKMVN